MAITVTQQDPRYQTLKKSRNLRMPASDADFASRIELCETASDTAEALQRIVSDGSRFQPFAGIALRRGRGAIPDQPGKATRGYLSRSLQALWRNHPGRDML